MKAHITEIFESIQGEGKYAGIRQVFVRFHACNIHCAWCDTPHDNQPVREYELDDLFNEIVEQSRECHSVSLTGGEPLLQADVLKILLPRLKHAKILSYLETNGILYESLGDLMDTLDIIAMDFKLPSSTQCPPFWDEHEKFLYRACAKDVFVKSVISSQTSEEDIRKSVEIIKKIDPNIFYILQPNSFDLNNGVMDKCWEYQKYCHQYLNNVRIVPQLHHLLNIK